MMTNEDAALEAKDETKDEAADGPDEGAPESAPTDGADAPGSEDEAAAGDAGGDGEADGPLDTLTERSAQILGHVSAIGTRLETVANDFVSKYKTDNKLQTAFDRLYEEMQQYKDNFLFQAQKPLLIDLILLYDQMQTAMESMEDEGAKGTVDMICEQLLEVMYRRDVEPMDFDPDAAFDREKMKAIKRVSTEDPAEDKRVERLVRQGFAWNERVLRPHEVIVKRLKQS